jgi:hypothetical protein
MFTDGMPTLERTKRQAETAYQLMILETLDTADRMAARLERLNAQFPSHDLREAVNDMRRWRDDLYHRHRLRGPRFLERQTGIECE